MKYGELIRRSWNIFRNEGFFIISLGGYLCAVLFMSALLYQPVDDQWLVIAALQLVLSSTHYIMVGVAAAAVNQIESEGASSFSMVWRAVSGKILRLMAIALLPAALSTMTSYGVASFSHQGANLATPTLVWGCGGYIAGFALGGLSLFASLACALEDTSFVGSYRRGWVVLTQNLGQVALLILIWVGGGFVVGLVVNPRCLSILLLAISGPTIALAWAFWTLAYREWAGIGASEESPSSGMGNQAE